MLPQAGSRLCFSEHLIPIQRLLPTRSPGRFWVIGTRPQAIGKKKKKRESETRDVSGLCYDIRKFH